MVILSASSFFTSGFTLALSDPSEQDEGIKKIQAAITAGMSANASHLQAYLKSWDKYRAIWEMNKDFFIQRYKRKNHPVSSFDADIQRYLSQKILFSCVFQKNAPNVDDGSINKVYWMFSTYKGLFVK